MLWYVCAAHGNTSKSAQLLRNTTYMQVLHPNAANVHARTLKTAINQRTAVHHHPVARLACPPAHTG